MAITKITYANKSALNVNSSVADTNKCNANDLNEIKTVVNLNADNIGDMANLTETSLVEAVNNNKGIIRSIRTTFTTSGSGTGWKYGSFTHTAPTGYKLIAVTTDNVKSADRNFFMFNINNQVSGSIYWCGYIGYGNYGTDNYINLIYIKEEYAS